MKHVREVLASLRKFGLDEPANRHFNFKRKWDNSPRGGKLVTRLGAGSQEPVRREGGHDRGIEGLRNAAVRRA